MKPKFDCPSDGFYPHERYCEKYYVCSNGVAEEKVCPENQLYDVEKKACNEEQETNCGKRIHPNGKIYIFLYYIHSSDCSGPPLHLFNTINW